jgi:diamine N-acetyltransferase
MDMNTLIGKEIKLRALEPDDLDFLYQLENDESVWEVSNTSTPYSKFVLKQYLDNAHRDIYEVKQLRLVICKLKEQSAIGFIDLFDFDPKNRRIGVGIVISSEIEREKGFAFEALNLVEKYAFKHLNVHQVFCNITEDNAPSIRLFEKAGYRKAGVKKDWIYQEGKLKDELLYQLIWTS